MKLLDWVLARWPKAAPVPARQGPVAPALWPTPGVPAKYLSLYTYLEHRYASTVVLTFEQMESLLGWALPATARTEPAWWTSENSPDRHCTTWTAAKRTAMPNLPAGIVAFERLP
jgi:hypothetical protein